jgi:hypothetical protein
VVVVLGMIPVLVELWLILKAAGCLISFFFWRIWVAELKKGKMA